MSAPNNRAGCNDHASWADGGPAPSVRCVRRKDVLRPAAGETLLDAARRQDVPLASPCSGHAVCGDCVVAVLSGAEHAPAPDPEELAWRVRRAYDGPLRLACRLRVTGDCSISTTYW